MTAAAIPVPVIQYGWEELSQAERIAFAASPEERDAFWQNLSAEEAMRLNYDWDFWARPEQKLPPGDWFALLLDMGRGSGKTRVGSETVRGWVGGENDPPIQIALIAETKADARDVIVQGPSGLMTVCPPWNRPKYEPSKRRLTWPNGSVGFLFSGDEPNQLRGSQFHKAWVDELAKYHYPQEAWDMLEYGLRLGNHPQALITTTPRPIPIMKKLLVDPQVIVVKGSTYRNLANLAPSFIERVIRRYEGTRLGRQELHAEMLTDAPGALWTYDLLERTRVAAVPDNLVRIVVAVDPAATSNENSNETGIIVAAKAPNGHAYVFRDVSDRYTPNEWGLRAVNLYTNYQADRVVGEKNQGGEMVAYVLKTVDPTVPVKLVNASRGSYTRAEPIASLYAEGKVHNVGVLPQLEDQMTTWTPDIKDWSPDRMDAMVWAVWELMIAGNEVGSADQYRSVHR